MTFSPDAPTVDLIGDTGPGPDAPGTGPVFEDPAPAPQPAAAGADELREVQVRGFLRALGDGTHAVVGVAEHDWEFIEADLDRIAPPLSRIMGRVPALAAVAEKSDEAAVALGFGLYGWRSAIERKTALATFEQQQAAPAYQPPPAQTNGAAPGPAVPDGYKTYADRLRETRPPEDQ